MLESFTCSTFAPLVGETFRLAAGGPDAGLVLIDATELAAPPGPGRAPFSIVFRGPPGAVLPQATYGLRHGALGAFELFLVPIGADAEGVRYEAVFT